MAEEGTDDVLDLLAWNHVLEGTVDEVLGASNILQMDPGVLEGQTRGDYILYFIIDPSVNQCTGQPKWSKGTQRLEVRGNKEPEGMKDTF